MLQDFINSFLVKKTSMTQEQEQCFDPKGFGAVFPLDCFFNGEKDLFAMDAAISRYNVDYYRMADRAYNLYITNEFVKAAVDRLVQFIVGLGLELYPIPKTGFLQRKLKVELPESFTEDVKDLWELYRTEKCVSADGEDNIDGLAKTVTFNAVLGGDVLVIRRVVDKCNQYQLVDGRNVKSSKRVTASGNKVKLGVEVDKTGRHVAYYVIDQDKVEQRIEAYDKYGNRFAWLSYCNKIRIGGTRGFSIIGAIIQILDKICEYMESETTAAATNAKFVATIDQDDNSTGLNPLNGTLGRYNTRATGVPTVTQSKVDDSVVSRIVSRLTRLTNGIIMHMPRGQKLNAYNNSRPNVNFSAFLDTTMKYAFASMGLPAEVVLMVFQNNFSASRASLKMFEFILKFMRKYLTIDGFYKYAYEHFFDLEVLKGNIDAPGYLKYRNAPGYADNAYMLCKFEGTPIPHIDPVKEVNAVVTKLKNGLTDFEGALQELGSKTNFETMCKSLSEQLEKFKKMGITLPGGIIKEKRKNKEEREGE